MCSFIGISVHGPLLKRGTDSQTFNDMYAPSHRTCSLRMNQVGPDHSTSEAQHCSACVWSNARDRPGPETPEMGKWLMNRVDRFCPWSGQTQIWGDFTLESSTTPKSMVCEFWIGALVSTLCPDIPVLTGGWWYYVSWEFHSWCLFMLTIGLE